MMMMIDDGYEPRQLGDLVLINLLHPRANPDRS